MIFVRIFWSFRSLWLLFQNRKKRALHHRLTDSVEHFILFRFSTHRVNSNSISRYYSRLRHSRSLQGSTCCEPVCENATLWGKWAVYVMFVSLKHLRRPKYWCLALRGMGSFDHHIELWLVRGSLWNPSTNHNKHGDTDDPRYYSTESRCSGSPRCGLYVSPHVRESGFRNPIDFWLWGPEFRALESRIQLKKSIIPLTTGIRNPSSTDNYSGIQYLKSGIHHVESRIQDCLGFS